MLGFIFVVDRAWLEGVLMHYKITIGDKVFDADSKGDGTFSIQNGDRDFTIGLTGLKTLEAKIEEIKEPLRVEFETTVAVSYSTGQYDDYVTKKGLLTFGDITWVGKKVKVTVTEILPTQCEHEWQEIFSEHLMHKCFKCGELK